jgi:protein-S-isoprenylcysteine O-methyltransferase Ste14
MEAFDDDGISQTAVISDQSSPDSIKIGGWLFRHRTAIPVPFALALLLLSLGEAPFSWTLVGAGTVLTLAGEAIRLWAVHHIGVISRTRSDRLGPLVDSGPFALVRNPLYIGNILLWVGFAITARLLWFAPIVLLLLAFEYHAIVQWEEQLLLSRIGDPYRAYMTRVGRWIPRFGTRRRSRRSDATPARDADGSAVPRFSWRDTFFSERGTLVAIGVGYILLWAKGLI